MKNLIIGLLVVGFTSLGFSQNNGIAAVELEGVTVTSRNVAYLNEVQDMYTPPSVIRLENRASIFDIKDTNIYDSNFEAYEVVFKQSNGKIIAIYDKNGQILSSSERFNNVSIPPSVRESIFKDHPEWYLHKDTYLVTYYLGKNVKKVYKVQLRKGSLKKNLKVDSDGNII